MRPTSVLEAAVRARELVEATVNGVGGVIACLPFLLLIVGLGLSMAVWLVVKGLCEWFLEPWLDFEE